VTRDTLFFANSFAPNSLPDWPRMATPWERNDTYRHQAPGTPASQPMKVACGDFFFSLIAALTGLQSRCYQNNHVFFLNVASFEAKCCDEMWHFVGVVDQHYILPLRFEYEVQPWALSLIVERLAFYVFVNKAKPHCAHPKIGVEETGGL